MFSGRKSNVLASNNDRDEAASLLRRHHEEGRLSEEELGQRLAAVRSAKTLGDLDSVHAGLPSLGFEKGRAEEHKLASDGDRERARTKLRQHHGEGRIGPDEFDDRMNRAGVAKTQAEIDLLFRDLPSLAPAGIHASLATGSSARTTSSATKRPPRFAGTWTPGGCRRKSSTRARCARAQPRLPRSSQSSLAICRSSARVVS